MPIAPNLNWLTQRAIQTCDRTALIFADRVWSYAEMEAEAIQIARNLSEQGIGYGCRVGILMENHGNYIFLIYALAKLGSIAVLLNTRLSAKELNWQMQDSATKFLIYDRRTEEKACEVIERFQTGDQTEGLKLIEIEAVKQADRDSQQRISQDFIPDIDLESIQAIIYTSGTTGKPKGVQLTYGNHFHSAIASAQNLDTDTRDNWLVCLPLFHVGGLSIIWRSVLDGSTITLEPRFDLERVIQAIAMGKITLISLVPTMLTRILDRLSQSDVSMQIEEWRKLRGILLGGAAPNQQLLERCLELKLPIMPTYGMTETASQIATLSPQDVMCKRGSVGQPLQCSQVRIVSIDFPEIELPIGEIGQILVKGTNVMAGYVNSSITETLRDGWLHTGDLGYVDSEGFLYVVSRRTDLIISGGENIYPAELEEILMQHPAIQDACVVGVSDREWGQIVVAVLVTTEFLTVTEIREFCLSRDLAKYKLPKAIHRVDRLPKTASGKLARHKVLESLS
ncbi:o-succinylbenzoate--CoA ligase [Tumidithrix elongata RA019]|uniref:2-succinylbenzoate--CoA ligase n=1 Tax=Tumidithrix elongata BACA0141 TaxID=2716417 RepID=A0AAW9PY17_9CYAN|nr:o-succinylbenzoate--CoA ligase [Tumidithrix elongata RA019]